LQRIHSHLTPKHDAGHGLFITLEGGEGSGKTTLMERLSEYLTQLGRVVVKTREPGGTPFGESIRQFLLSKQSDMQISAESELLLFLSSRAQHIDEVILPGILSNKIILCDRFNDSTIAYQGFGRNLGYAYTKSLCDLVCHGLKPHLTLFLDVEPNLGLARTKALSKEHAKSGEMDRIESEEIAFHEKVRQGFFQLAKDDPERIVIINTNQSKDDVYKESLQAVEKLLKANFKS
jgi:dTMP kinase